MALGFLYGAGGAPTSVNTFFTEVYGAYTAPSYNTQQAKTSTIKSSVIDSTTKLRFNFTHYAGTYAANFRLLIEISIDETNWVEIYRFSASGDTTPTVSGDVDLSSYVGNKVFVRVTLQAISNGAAQGNMNECIIGHFSS